MTSDFASLLSRLKELPKGTTLEQAVAQIRTPKTPELESARTNAARVRFLDQGVMTVLGNVELNDLVQAFPGDFERVLPDRWTVRSSLRESLLEGMRKNVPDFRSWNTKLYLYYKGLGGKTERLEAVYHAAASSELSEGQKDFEAWFAEANKISDFAYCSALLDVLQLQSGFYGNTFNQSYRDRSRLLQSRLLFLDELKKSGSYLDREKVQEAALKVIQRTGNKPWIFHVHATGGMGKTMFLRWLTARYAVPLRIPCARIDFDEHQNEKLIELVDHPIGLLSMIVDQWAKQMPDTSILSAADTLAKAKTMTGWDSKTLDTYQTLMQSVTVTGPLLLVFDTLEEATLAQLPWLKRCIEELAKLHELLPTLTLVLSGRYDLSSRAVFTAGDATVFEIEGFSHDEASSFLQRRKIAEDLRQAILDPAFDLAKERPRKTAPKRSTIHSKSG